MSYVDEIYEKVVEQNPGENEFHQAVKEVLDSLKLVIDANEEKYRKMALLERLVEPERIISLITVRCRSTKDTEYNSTAQSGPIKEVFAFTPQ